MAVALRRLTCLLVVVGVLLAGAFIAEDFPSLPMGIFSLSIPVCALVLRSTVLHWMRDEEAMRAFKPSRGPHATLQRRGPLHQGDVMVC